EQARYRSVIGGAQAQPREPPAQHGGPSHSLGFGARLGRAVTRLQSPLGYLLFFGGLQLGLMFWLSRFWPVWLIVAGAVALGAEVVAVAVVGGHWPGETLGLLLVIALLVVGPAVVLMRERALRGIASAGTGGASPARVALGLELQRHA